MYLKPLILFVFLIGGFIVPDYSQAYTATTTCTFGAFADRDPSLLNADFEAGTSTCVEVNNFSTSSSSDMATTTIVTSNDQLLTFFLLFGIFVLTLHLSVFVFSKLFKI